MAKTNLIVGMRKAIVLSALFFFGLVLFSACKKTGEVTPSFSESDLNATFTDTITVISTTLSDDSIRTDEVSRSLAGTLNDPQFGITQASFYTQFKLSTTQLQFPTGATLDSAVLVMEYDDFYGKDGQTITVSAHELTQDLSAEEAYYNNSTVSFNSIAIGQKTFTPDLSDTLSIDSASGFPQIRMKLDNELGERIVNHSFFADNDEFATFFKGLYIGSDTTAPSSGNGAIVSFNLLADASRILLYYHYPGEGSEILNDEYEVFVSATTPRFTNFVHKFDGTPIPAVLGDAKAELNYVQSMGGLKVKIDFPNVDGLTKNGPIAINKAELVITVAEGSADEFAVAERLVLLTEDTDGDDIFIPDFFEGTDYYGGKYDVNTNTYKFNIARYFDQIVNEKITSNGLYLIVSGSAVNANRLIMNSGRHPTGKLKLRLTFTQL